MDALLRDRPGPLCGTCHADMASTLSRPVVHEPVALGRCVDCHAPHGGDNAHFLVQRGARLDLRNKQGRTPLEAAMSAPEPNAASIATLKELAGAAPTHVTTLP